VFVSCLRMMVVNVVFDVVVSRVVFGFMLMC